MSRPEGAVGLGSSPVLGVDAQRRRELVQVASRRQAGERVAGRAHRKLVPSAGASSAGVARAQWRHDLREAAGRFDETEQRLAHRLVGSTTPGRARCTAAGWDPDRGAPRAAPGGAPCQRTANDKRPSRVAGGAPRPPARATPRGRPGASSGSGGSRSSTNVARTSRSRRADAASSTPATWWPSERRLSRPGGIAGVGRAPRRSARGRARRPRVDRPRRARRRRRAGRRFGARRVGAAARATGSTNGSAHVASPVARGVCAEGGEHGGGHLRFAATTEAPRVADMLGHRRRGVVVAPRVEGGHRPRPSSRATGADRLESTGRPVPRRPRRRARRRGCRRGRRRRCGSASRAPPLRGRAGDRDRRAAIAAPTGQREAQRRSVGEREDEGDGRSAGVEGRGRCAQPLLERSADAGVVASGRPRRPATEHHTRSPPTVTDRSPSKDTRVAAAHDRGDGDGLLRSVLELDDGEVAVGAGDAPRPVHELPAGHPQRGLDHRRARRRGAG